MVHYSPTAVLRKARAIVDTPERNAGVLLMLLLLLLSLLAIGALIWRASKKV